LLDGLAQSHADVRADLNSLELSEPAGGELLARVRSALELSAAPSSSATTRFELTALEDVSPPALELTPGAPPGPPFTRRARATAVGELLLHGFRVLRRVAVEAEFGFTDPGHAPSTVVIRTRTPFVVSLETHAIQTPEAAHQRRHPGAPARPPEALVSIELYGTKID
jgi:hypothetical protein